MSALRDPNAARGAHKSGLCRCLSAGMTRKLSIAGACVIVAGLLAFVVIRGGKRMHRSEPPRDGFSLTVDLPKTNNTAPKATGR